ncbi:MAG: hypothetical protein MZV70_68130 [Desulfobacterales bacterium]|nr:hypothetical protein [Desulfobacterales bacterium]
MTGCAAADDRPCRRSRRWSTPRTGRCASTAATWPELFANAARRHEQPHGPRRAPSRRRHAGDRPRGDRRSKACWSPG